MGLFIFRNALFLFCLVLIVLNTACKPKPVISVDKDGGCAPLAVNFDAGKSSDMGKDIREYLWDLNGDGVFETHGVKAAYTYRKSGEYKVGLRVTDSKNNVAETSFMIHASGVPSADINADDGYITAGEKTRITWNASGADSVIISQGIGRVENTGSIEVSPLRNTTYTITATNPCGTNTDSVEIRVNSTACTAVITRTAPTGCNSVNEAFDASLSTDTDNDITSYEWDFDNDGTTDATGIRTNHTFSGEGNYTTKLTIRDAKGNSSEATVDTRIYGRTSLDFTVDSQDVVYPDSAVLRWHAENVTSVSLYDSALDVTLNYPVNNITFTDNVVYRPVYYPTTLTVTATGPCGSVSKSFSMTPHPTRCDARYTTGLRAGCTPFTLNFDAS